MRKCWILIAGVMLSSFLFSACNYTKSNNTINYQRKFAEYLPEKNATSKGSLIDLSEGPKIKYEANFGPKDLNFDIKINNPY